MKKILTLLLLHHTIFAQVTTLPNSIGIGKPTESTIPFHINAPSSTFEIARFQGVSPFISFYNSNTLTGYIQPFSNIFSIGAGANMNFQIKSDNLVRLNINGVSGISTVYKRMDFIEGISMSGPLIAHGFTAGTSGQVLVSQGNSAAPIWQDRSTGQEIGFSAYLRNDTTINNSQNYIMRFMYEIYDDGNNFNPNTGEFTAPKSGLYHFTVTPHIANNTTIIPIGNSVVITAMTNLLVNNTLVRNNITQTTINGTYGSSIQYSAQLKLNAGDKVTVQFAQSSGSTQKLSGSSQLRPLFSGYLAY
jgi:hypothetical protein